MRKVPTLILLLLAVNCMAQAQKCGKSFLGSKALYKQPAVTNVAAPDGYVPFFINHVGRHGARYTTKSVNSSNAYQLIFKADSVGQLTPEGARLKEMVSALQIVVANHAGDISDEGQSEQEGIGARMAQHYGTIFAHMNKIHVWDTKEKRTLESADCFFRGLYRKLRPLRPDSTIRQDSVHLRFYDLSLSYKKFENGVDTTEPKISFDKQLRLKKINDSVAYNIFKPTFFGQLNASQKNKFVSDIFGFACIVYSLRHEIDSAGLSKQIDFESFFNCGQLYALGSLNSADEYLKKGPGVNNYGIQVRVAMPLLVEFINSADDQIKSGKYGARLRFAHAETIAPIAALFQIEGADKSSSDIWQINRIWRAAEVIPLSSNIQWIFYKKKNGAGDYLVKVLFNEKVAHISGLGSANYYRWNTLRAFYMDKLHALSVKN